MGIIIILLYFVPAVTAYENKKKNKQSILVINIFLGWTFIGWIVALAMAVGKNAEPSVEEKSAHKVTTALQDLVALKEKGHITQEEFEKQKRKILE